MQFFIPLTTQKRIHYISEEFLVLKSLYNLKSQHSAFHHTRMRKLIIYANIFSKKANVRQIANFVMEKYVSQTTNAAFKHGLACAVDSYF